MQKAEVLLLGYKILRSELIPVYDQAPLVTVIAHFAGDHLDGHTDLHGVVVYIGQLGGDHRALIQLYQGNSVRRVTVIPAGGFINGGKGIDLALATKCIEFLGFVAAVRADVARRENLIITMRAYL